MARTLGAYPASAETQSDIDLDQNIFHIDPSASVKPGEFEIGTVHTPFINPKAVAEKPPDEELYDFAFLIYWETEDVKNLGLQPEQLQFRTVADWLASSKHDQQWLPVRPSVYLMLLILL